MRVPLACAFLLGVAGGARTMLPAATVTRAVRAGTLCVRDTPLAFAESQNLGRLIAVMALAELVIDKLPMTPSRKMTAAFAARLVSGGLAGAAIGIVHVARRWELCSVWPALWSAQRAARRFVHGCHLSSSVTCRLR